jgi:beta-lactamase superfamily II metal-dependent hydrolase
MDLADLQPQDDLTLLLMGPGFGESTLVGWPPDDWLVVDSFRRTHGRAEIHPVIDVLGLLHIEPAAVALTHPHQDHASGFASLVERRRAGGLVGWVTDPRGNPQWTTPNAVMAERQGTTEHAIAAIERVWSEDPKARWSLHSAAPATTIGDATIEVLSPRLATIDELRTASHPDLNLASSVLLVTWKNCRILLGADLPNPGWDILQEQHGPLHFSDTSAFKIAHHGSHLAQHSVALGKPPPRDRLSLATPYNKGKKVPSIETGGDIDQLLNLTVRVFMTTSHGRLPQNSGNSDITRGALASPTLRVGRQLVQLDPPTPPPEDCWIAATLGSDGVPRRIERGKSSVCIVAG